MLLQSLKARGCQKISPFQVHVFSEGPEEGGRDALPPMMMIRLGWNNNKPQSVHANSVCEKARDSTTLINTFVFDFQYLENLLPADPSTSINVKNPLRTSQEYLENILRPYLNICSSFCSFVPSLMTRIIIMNSWNFNWFDVPLWRRHNREELIFGEMGILVIVSVFLAVCVCVCVQCTSPQIVSYPTRLFLS